MKTFMVAAFVCYFLGMIKYFLHLAVPRKHLFVLATALIGVGFLFHTAMLVSLSLQTGHGPYKSSFEYTSFFAWTTMGALMTAVVVYRIYTLGVFMSPVGFLLMAYTFLLPQAAAADVPVKAFWMTMHHTVSFLALSSFVVVFAVSVMYLIQERQLKRHSAGALFQRMPDLDTLDTIFHRSLLFGFPAITVGVGAGIIWSSSHFHTLLGPNPTKSFPMVFVWVIYATLMVARSLIGWRGHKMAVLGSVGFVFTLAALAVHLR